MIKIFLSIALLCMGSAYNVMAAPINSNASIQNKQKESAKYKYVDGTFSITYNIYDDNTFVEVIIDASDGTSESFTGTWEFHEEFQDVIIFLPEGGFPSAFRVLKDKIVEVDEDFNFTLDENNKTTEFKLIK